MPTRVKKIEISQIVLLKRLMKRWRSLSLRRRSLLPRSYSGSGSGSVRAGFMAVYVGPDRRRSVIPARFMNFPVFASLLEKAEEELGFQPAGGLALTCDVAFFDWVVGALGRDEERFKGVGLDGFLTMFADLGFDESGFGCVPSRDSFSPLLQKTRA